VLGNWGCPPDLYPQALDLVLQGRIRIDRFIERHPMSDINSVFEAAHQGKLTRRAVLIPTA
jgi:6-hydroxycyclohex-1-ene-1-carbonyl-CoA dehydrogenase